MNEQLEQLIKALEAGQYDAAPSTLAQGSALQKEDLSPVMEIVTAEEKILKLRKAIPTKSHKSTLVQFNRKLDYGILGGSAQFEVGIGEEDVATVVRATVPMSFYSTVKRTGIAATHIQTFDGNGMLDNQEKDAAQKLAFDIEYDCFKGQADFSNAGIFDGHPGAIARIPNMVGVDAQVRMSDSLSNTQDLMFAHLGAAQSVILPVNGGLGQASIEDGAVKSAMNNGSADVLFLDPISLAGYNKIAFAKERIMLAGSAQSNSGASLREQWTSNGLISLESSKLLSGKVRPNRSRNGAPSAPSASGANTANSASVLAAGAYVYFVTACNERGESVASASVAVTITTGDAGVITINAVTGAKYYEVFRSAIGGSASSAKFIGKVAASAAATTVFTDLGLKSPGFVTGYLIQKDTMEMAQLASFTSQELAISNLSLPKAYYQFESLAVKQPKKNVLFDNIA